ncbi:MAG TPA: hypothetical protein VF120_11755 [Ktedonobacterales bacterium]
MSRDRPSPPTLLMERPRQVTQGRMGSPAQTASPLMARLAQQHMDLLLVLAPRAWRMGQ